MIRNPSEQLEAYLDGQGLKSTRQRDEILRIFLDAGHHVSADELYRLARKSMPGIGYATVYRTLRLFTEAGIAHERHFDDGLTRYEPHAKDTHHDHLICLRCGTIIEFENEQIEKLQSDVARRHRFAVQNHKLELYGLCESCQPKKRKS
ncbi:MAG: Fur family transcriptional regulator [Nitrospiraceae bacterium]|nr:Fur family transcriptional regulator [Nitrospiraceae bacterium]